MQKQKHLTAKNAKKSWRQMFFFAFFAAFTLRPLRLRALVSTNLEAKEGKKECLNSGVIRSRAGAGNLHDVHRNSELYFLPGRRY
jgi:hypothetical protein